MKLFILGSLLIFGIGITHAQLNENFDSGFPTGWTQNASPISWNHSTTGGNTTPGAMYAFDTGSSNGEAWLQTPWMDLTTMVYPRVEFSAVSVRNNYLAPVVSLWYDIGNGWVLLDDWGGLWNQTSDNAVFPDVFVSDPSTWEPQISDWYDLAYDLTTLNHQSNIRFAFGYEGINGGAIWLDDIRIFDNVEAVLNP